LILGEQQYFVWDTASQSTKRLDIIKILGEIASLGYTHAQRAVRTPTPVSYATGCEPFLSAGCCSPDSYSLPSSV